MDLTAENTSNSSSSIMSLDKSDTNQSVEKLSKEQKEDSTSEKGHHRNFSQISEIKDKGFVGASNLNTIKSVVKNEENVVHKSDEHDDDLAELNSELLSKQMSKVVTQLEKQVIDDTEECIRLPKKSQVDKIHTVTIDLTENVKTEGEDIETSNSNSLEIDQKEGMEIDEEISEFISQEKTFGDVQIKVIDVPEDDDLFDFLKVKQPGEMDHEEPNLKDQMDESSNISDALDKQEHEDIQKRELYRFLTASDPTLIHSNEVTPYHSGDENKSESESSSKSGSTEELSSESDDDHEDTLQHYLENTSEIDSRPPTPVEEDHIETPVKVRRKPGRKPRQLLSLKRII